MSVRITPEQARLLFGSGPSTKQAPRAKKRREDLPENQVAGTIIDYLRAHGWVCIRRQSGLYSRPSDPASRIRIGEVGESDWECMRSRRGEAGRVDLFTLECKARGCVPSPEQIAYIRKRKALGFVAVWFDNFRAFETWMAETWL